MDLYQDQLRKPHTSVVECDFDAYFDQQLKELEGSTARSVVKEQRTGSDDLTPPSSSGTGPDDAPPPLPGLLKGECLPSVQRLYTLLICATRYSAANPQ